MASLDMGSPAINIRHSKYAESKPVSKPKSPLPDLPGQPPVFVKCFLAQVQTPVVTLALITNQRPYRTVLGKQKTLPRL